LFTLFLIFPKVSSAVLSLYLCRRVEGTSYLIADFSEECYTDRWNSFLPFDIVMILLYPFGIPVLFISSLILHRRVFEHPGTRLQLGFLYDGYSLRTWWFELVDMVHKLLLTSLLAFMPDGVQLPLGMSIAFLYGIIILESRPYFRKGDDRLHLFAQVEIFLLLEAGYVYKDNNARLDRKSDVVVSIFLIGVVLGFLGVFVTQTFNIAHKVFKRWSAGRQDKKPKASDDDIEESSSSKKTGKKAGSVPAADTELAIVPGETNQPGEINSKGKQTEPGSVDLF